MSKATPEQLANLPGFGQVKVKNIKNAFEKPFRNQVTNTLASISASQTTKEGDNDGREKNGDKGQVGRRVREPSPVWDIEVDGPSPVMDPKKDNNGGMAGRRVREPSPVWDIELDP
jgi:DNA excision repair protein ERCC-1